MQHLLRCGGGGGIFPIALAWIKDWTIKSLPGYVANSSGVWLLSSRHGFNVLFCSYKSTRNKLYQKTTNDRMRISKSMLYGSTI